jgi:hypothetical protein
VYHPIPSSGEAGLIVKRITGLIGMVGARCYMEFDYLSTSDRMMVERQLNRRLRGEVQAAARCPYGEVEVIATAPILPDGTPFPTLFWLTCPLLQRAVSGLENGEFRDDLRHKMGEDPGFGEALSQAETDYVAKREKWAEEQGYLEVARKSFNGREGIGGTMSGGIKCLHAHLAHFLAGGDNPVGAEVQLALQGLQDSDCRGDCRPFLREEQRWRAH